MSYRVIEAATEVAARAQGISPLPDVMYYLQPPYGLCVDYIIDTVPEALIPATLHCCSLVDGVYTVLNNAIAQGTGIHNYAGWPQPGEGLQPATPVG